MSGPGGARRLRVLRLSIASDAAKSAFMRRTIAIGGYLGLFEIFATNNQLFLAMDRK